MREYQQEGARLASGLAGKYVRVPTLIRNRAEAYCQEKLAKQEYGVEHVRFLLTLIHVDRGTIKRIARRGREIWPRFGVATVEPLLAQAIKEGDIEKYQHPDSGTVYCLTPLGAERQGVRISLNGRTWETVHFRHQKFCRSPLFPTDEDEEEWENSVQYGVNLDRVIAVEDEVRFANYDSDEGFIFYGDDFWDRADIINSEGRAQCPHHGSVLDYPYYCIRCDASWMDIVKNKEMILGKIEVRRLLKYRRTS